MQAVAPRMWNLVLALLDSRDRRCRSMPSSATPSATSFAQEEMDLGEFGGDVIGERTDDDDSDVDVFDKQPKKRQRRAADRNVALLKIKAVVVISILLQSSNERCNFLQGWMGFFMKSTCSSKGCRSPRSHRPFDQLVVDL
ncbi:hypothetical protein PAXRUDRAFT_278897 [Paxillus rubicundulus Ve08.2h10]|uniref:Uncharacterized protein n=1 Tax=Paxillus rubicundulus Ve08.2h10 TaxID=930991 RepID=A0A0D0CVK9_9AGAM|nr:hypothetical protein PAXRUDRAFT_278897 [Paxillus rubicundulus Ve08.2h10]